MDIVSNLIIQNESVDLDGKHFIDCTLLNCILEYSGGDIIFERTRIRGCRHVFYGRARMTLQYLHSTGLVPHNPSEWGDFQESVLQ